MLKAPDLPQIPTAPAPPPMFGQQPGQKKPQAKSMQPTFLGAEQQAPANGGKTLLGQ